AADETVQLANEAAVRLLHLPAVTDPRQPVEQVVRDPRLLQLIREAHETLDGSVRRHVEHCMIDGDRAAVFDLTLARMGRPAIAADRPPEDALADWATAPSIDLPADAFTPNGTGALRAANGGRTANETHDGHGHPE